MANVEEAQDILEILGMPPAQQNFMAGMTLIALCGLTPDSPWFFAKRRRCMVTKGIMDYLGGALRNRLRGGPRLVVPTRSSDVTQSRLAHPNFADFSKHMANIAWVL